MDAVVRKWGNSLALRLPQRFAQELGIVDGAAVRLSIEDGTLTVRVPRRQYRLADLLFGLTPEMRRGEVDWGRAEGNEEW